MQDENFRLETTLAEKEKAFKEKEEELTDKLLLATSVLNEVGSLGIIQGLSKDEARNLEAQMGIDLDGDGVVG